MRTKLLVFVLLFSSATIVFAQKKKGDEPAPQTVKDPKSSTLAGRTATTEHTSDHMAVYRLAKSYADYRTAANALYYELIANPNSIALKDSLAVMYYALGANLQAIALGKEVLEKEENNQRMLEVVAVSYNNIGALKESLENYEKLHKLSGEAFHLYQIAIIQYTLKRTYECQVSLGQLIQHPKAEEQKVTITIDRERQQEVPIKAAAYNVLGVMQQESNALDEARKSFEAALALDKDFILPKANLKQMDEDAKPAKQ